MYNFFTFKSTGDTVIDTVMAC